MGNSRSHTKHNYHQNGFVYVQPNSSSRFDRQLLELPNVPVKNDNLSTYRHDSHKIVLNSTHDAFRNPNSMSSKAYVYHKTPTNLEKKAQGGLHTNSAYTHVQPKVGMTSNTNPQIYPLKKTPDNEIQIINNGSASITTVKLSKFATRDDFMKTWFSWKNSFLEYMKSIDKTESNEKNLGTLLLNRMGPVGQIIYKTFSFDDDYMKENIDILLKKFDFYCIFGDTKKQDNEKINEYINNLRVMALKHMNDIDDIIKKKILMEIDQTKFTAKAKSLIPEFSFRSDVNSLTIEEITYIWILYENLSFKQIEEIDQFQVRNCSNCGNTHKKDKCPAHGKICTDCGITNHFWIRCPRGYGKCLYCGESHFKRQCPANGNRCKICQKLNHFFWRCPNIRKCNFCDSSHILSRSLCPALNTICAKCKQRGHVPSKCRKSNIKYNHGNNFSSTSRLNV